MKIDEKYSVETEGAGCALVFTEMREKTKKDTQEKEMYEFKDYWYYPTVVDCLQKYLHLCQEPAKDVKECIRITKETLKQLSK